MSNTSATVADRVAVAPALLERHGAALRTYLAQLPGAEAKRVEVVAQEVLREIQTQVSLDEDPAVWLFERGRRRLIGSGQRGDVMLAQADEAAEMDDPAEDGRVAAHRAFGRLTSKQQEALRLKFQFGFNLEELAHIAGLSASGAAGLLHHAMDRIVQATGGAKAEGRIRDPRITAYALDEMGPEEKKMFVESVPDAKALLAGAEAIRQAGRHMAQVLESGAALPKRRRRRKGATMWRWVWGGVGLGLALLIGYVIKRPGDPVAARSAVSQTIAGRDSVVAASAANKEGKARGGAQGAGVVARVAQGRMLRPGEAAWEKKAFGVGTGQGGGETGGAGAPLAGAEPTEGGVRSPGSATGGLGSEVAAEARGERGEDETGSSNERPEEVASPGSEPTGEKPEEADEAGAGGMAARSFAPGSGRAAATTESPGKVPVKSESRSDQAARAVMKPSPVLGIGELKQRLAQKQWPKPGEVSVAELVKQGPPERPVPATGAAAAPLTAEVELAPSPWSPGKQVMRVRVQAKPVPPPSRRPVNLVLAIDVSESMRGSNRLPLVQEGVRLLAERLRSDDRVGVVSYAGQAVEVLPGVPLGEHARELRSSLNALKPAGLTNGYAGLELAYEAARRTRIDGGLNVVVLCTDGNFNLGETDDRVLADLVKQAAEEGITLSVFGFGRSDRNDLRLEVLARQGGGRSCYVNTREEAERLLAGQIDGLLAPAARDVVVRVEFNPELVAEGRRVGAEEEEVEELLPGRNLTSLFEVTIKAGARDASRAWAGLRVDYRRPGTMAPEQLVQPLAGVVRDWAHVDPGFKFSVAMAEFGRILQGEAAGSGPELTRLESWMREQLPEDAGGYRQELLELLTQARLAAGGTGAD